MLLIAFPTEKFLKCGNKSSVKDRDKMDTSTQIPYVIFWEKKKKVDFFIEIFKNSEISENLHSAVRSQ